MIHLLFPYMLQLNVLQLEEYSIRRFLSWVFSNFFKRKLAGKKKLVWTQKAKLIFVMSVVQAGLVVIALTCLLGFVGLVVGFVIITQPFIFLIVSALLLKPGEVFVKARIKCVASIKIKNLKQSGLQVIGITGSFGKTTTKEILYNILKTKYKVLKTPESYNTLLGIAGVIDYELDSSYDFFVVEMGAYCIGEIKELCSMVQPDHAILTGINEQHLERFGCIANTVRAKFELVEYVAQTNQSSGLVILNEDNELINDSYKKYVVNPIFYKADNALAASTLALRLGVSRSNIDTALANLPPVPHRLEVKELENGWTLIDDSYNSNVDGFGLALKKLALYKNRTKIIVTPGIVELGKETKPTHHRLGKLTNSVCDYVILVAKTERTEALAEVINPRKVIFIENTLDYVDSVKELNVTRPVILIENDLPDNY